MVYLKETLEESYMYAKPKKVKVKKYTNGGAYIIEYENGKKELINKEELFKNFETRWTE